MTHTTVHYEVQGPVARITLNRPQAANSVNLDLARDLAEAALECGEDPAVRVVVLAGAGKTFCAGGDLKDFHSQRERLAAHAADVTTYLHTAVSRLVRLEVPVIAAVHGNAAGAGMSLACACDLVVAAQSARFLLAYTQVGLTPDGSATYFLPRLVGLKRALDLALTNRVLSAGEAEQWGIVSRVVPDAELQSAVDELAQRLAAGPTGAFGAAKRLLRDAWTETLETQMALETRAIAARGRTADAQEGILAFLEKRKPQFRGD